MLSDIGTSKWHRRRDCSWSRAMLMLPMLGMCCDVCSSKRTTRRDAPESRTLSSLRSRWMISGCRACRYTRPSAICTDQRSASA